MKKIKIIIYFAFSIIFILLFHLNISLEKLNHYEHINTPYYMCVVKNVMFNIIPSIIFIVLGILSLKKEKEQTK